MAIFRVEGDRVRLALGSWERAGALHGDVTFRRAQVRDVRVVPSAMRAVRGLRAPGTGWPGVIALGTFRGRGYRDFVAAYRHRPGVVVDLDGAAYARLVVTTEEPERVARALAG